ncbi:MAG: glycosyltransferase family 4 protein [Planctomycetes bacterium]|nr:glycosyltransferase family 4 protein [Planctomycetota bacterium]
MIVGIDYRPALLQFAGIARYGRMLAKALAREMAAGDELKLFAYSWAKPRIPAELWDLRAPRVHLYRRRFPGRALLLANQWFGRGADDWIGGCDLFHRTDFVRLPVRKAKIVATVFDASFAYDESFHGPDASRNLMKVTKQLIDEASVVLAPSEFAAGDLIVRCGANLNKVVVTPLGMDHFPHMPMTVEPPHPTPYLLTLGTVEPRKNHLRCLRVFEKLRAAGYKYYWVVAGKRGWLVDEFYHSLEKSPARNYIILDEDVPEHRLANLVKHASLVLYPSLYEGFGLPPLEAQALGVPTVTSAVTSMPEVCGEAAAYCDPEDEDSIHDAICSVLDNERRRRELIEGGLENAKRFTWERSAKTTLAAYRRALNPPPPRPFTQHP